MPSADLIKDKLFPRKIDPYLLIALYSRIFYWLGYLIITFFMGAKDLLASNCRYDCYWYLGITSNGYTNELQVSVNPKSANWGFFPFFPYLTRIVHLIIPIDERVLGYLVNNLLFLAGTLFLGKYLESKYGKRTSIATVWLICFSPVNVYLNTAYSEASFYCFLAALLWFIQSERTFPALAAASLLGISRNTGLIITILLIFSWQLGREKSRRNFFKASVMSLAPFLVLGAHILVLQRVTGDFLAIVHGHAVGRGNPVTWILQTINLDSVLQVALLLLYLLTFYVCLKNFKEKNYYECLIMIPVILTSTTYPGFINWRYILILFPIYLLIAQSNLIGHKKHIINILFVLEPALLLFAIYSWVSNFGFMV
jgi:hypothetical protein